MTTTAAPAAPRPATDYTLYYFSELLGMRVSETRAAFRIGKLADLVFRLSEPYPEAVGIYIDHGWGNPTELIPWDRVIRIERGTIFVQPPETGERYAPFVDQPGWILLNEHLMGKEVLDIEDRRVAIVNDVHLLASRGRMVLVHVDTSFNGFLRKWHLAWLSWQKDELIGWRNVQPLSLEDAAPGKRLSLSVVREQMAELPSEDLADALEELSGPEQEAVFSALEPEKAAETLIEAEPRAQRQLVADLPPERAREILAELSVAQIADLLEVLPLEDRNELMLLLSKDRAARTRALLEEHDPHAHALMSSEFVALPPETTVRDALAQIRTMKPDPRSVHYVYVVQPPTNVLLGVVDLRETVLAEDAQTLGNIMTAPAVSADQYLVEEEIEEMFEKYRYRALPVVDAADQLLGIVHFKDIVR